MTALLLTCALLLGTASLQGHPISQPSDTRYPQPVLSEDGAAIGPGEFSLSPSGTGQGFPSLLPEDRHGDGLRSAAFFPVGSAKEGLLETPGPLHPFRRFLGPGTQRRPYEKRGGPTECFWKYCV